ncbi:hypothetical protein ACFQ1I_29390 [Kitasatospora arboriphila]
MAFAQSTVDATSGEATAMLEWTLTDGNVAATDVTGDVVVQQVGADGRGIGPEHHVTFRHQPDSWFKANAVSGTPQSAVYRYDFPVPRYAATPTATWAVVKVTAKDDQGTALTVGRSRLNGPHTSVTATELVDGTGPGYESFYLKSQSRFRYLDGNPVAYQYSFTALDEESGFHRARLTVGGPGGATVTGDVETNTLSWGLIECGPDGFETSPGAVYCNLPVTFPADTPEGTWTPSAPAGGQRGQHRRRQGPPGRSGSAPHPEQRAERRRLQHPRDLRHLGGRRERAAHAEARRRAGRHRVGHRGDRRPLRLLRHHGRRARGGVGRHRHRARMGARPQRPLHGHRDRAAGRRRPCGGLRQCLRRPRSRPRVPPGDGSDSVAVGGLGGVRPPVLARLGRCEH